MDCLLQTAQPDPIEIQKQQEARRRAIARKRAKQQLKPRTPEPVEGRKHIDVQTELYLEELTDRVEEADVHTQTDAFLDRPPSPLFIPAKTGVDVATQILEGEVNFYTTLFYMLNDQPFSHQLKVQHHGIYFHVQLNNSGKQFIKIVTEIFDLFR